MPILKREGILFNYQTEGEETPIVFLHGLGGDLNQPRSLFGKPAGYQSVYFDCRAHGKTAPVGPDNMLNFDQLAKDMVGLFTALQIKNPVLCGISMGAGIAVNIALRYSVRGLVLIRPAWLDKPNPPNLAVFSLIARLLRERRVAEGKRNFMISSEYRYLQKIAPAVAGSLLGQFDDSWAVERCARLERMPASCPVARLADCQDIACPTLVAATDTDPVHPLEYGHILSKVIPSAKFVQIPSKSINPIEHVRELRKLLKAFLFKG